MRYVLIILMSLSILGCASFGMKLKSFLRGEPVQQPKKVVRAPKKTFTKAPNYLPGVKRKYSRMTKSKLENQNGFSENDGSLWVMEGQGSYLFSQNIMRMIGDPIPVRIEGESKEQLQSKAKIINELLAKLQQRRAALHRRPAAQKKVENKEEEPKPKAKTAAGPKQKQTKPAETGDFSVKTVPTRIVERLVDGNYRVKGSQPFMLGSREYKVIVTGIVRSEDFSEDGISSTRLLDSKFDIVSKRRRE